MAVAVGPFRAGERWARRALWVLPLHAALDLAIVGTHGGRALAALAWDAGLFLRGGVRAEPVDGAGADEQVHKRDDATAIGAVMVEGRAPRRLAGTRALALALAAKPFNTTNGPRRCCPTCDSM